MQGLGCAVAADKGEVPVLLMMHYIGIHDEDKERQETKAVKNSASHPATLAGLFMQLLPRTPDIHPMYIKIFSYGTPQLSS